MSELRIKLFIIYVIAVIAAYVLKKLTLKMAKKAIEEQKIETGIYRLFPVYGQRAVELAKGHIFAVKLVFWFVVFIFPFMFLMAYKLGAI